MKTSLLFLFLMGAALMALPLPKAAADDVAAPGPSAPSDGSNDSGTSGGQGQRLERFKQAMAALYLTDAQKEQIKQIRANVTDRKVRREQVMAVLTPDQKAKLRELIQEHRNASPAGGGTSSTPSAN